MSCLSCQFSKQTTDINPLDFTRWCNKHRLFCPDDKRCSEYAFNGPVMQVRCPVCQDIYLETTECYDPDRKANGTMFRLTETYGPNGYNWSSFPADEWIIADALECPGCGACICGPDGKVAIPRKEEGDRKQEESKEETEGEVTAAPVTLCPFCARQGKKMPLLKEKDRDGWYCDLHGMVRPEAALKKEEKAQPVSAHVCPKCGTAFKTAAALGGHMGHCRTKKGKD